MIKFTILGNPISSKNSIRSGITKSGRNYTYTTKNVKDYRDSALKQLMLQKIEHNKKFDTAGIMPEYGEEFPIDDFVQVSFIFYVSDNRKRDLINLIQCPADLLQQAGIILNDYLIINLDGSRIAGIDKDNPRTEIFITLLKDNNHNQ